jgi:hypothetical protein
MRLKGYKAIIEEFNTNKVKGQLLSLYNKIEAVVSQNRSQKENKCKKNLKVCLKVSLFMGSVTYP